MRSADARPGGAKASGDDRSRRPEAVSGARGLSFAEAGRRYLQHAEVRGRKHSTLANVESELKALDPDPFFKSRSLQSIAPRDVDELVRTLAAKGTSPKSSDSIATLSAICNFAEHRFEDGSRRTRAMGRAPRRPRASGDQVPLR